MYSRKRFLLLVIVLMSFHHVSLYSDEKSIDVLVLDSYYQTVPWTESFLDGLESTRGEYKKDINFFIEYLDISRMPNSLSDEEWIVYLDTKYREIEFDIVLADSNEASSFLKRNCNYFGSNIPLIYYSTLPVECNKSNEKRITVDIAHSVKKTVEMALRQNPETQKLVLIEGLQFNNTIIISTLRNIVQENTRLELSIITVLSVEEMLEEVMALSPHTVLLYSIVMWDKEGRSYVPKEVLSQIVGISPAPVYTFWSSLMGSGVVGGHMIDGNIMASQMMKAGIDYLSAHKFESSYHSYQPCFDWTAIDKYGINKNNVSQEVRVINKPVPFWEIYFNELMQLTALLAFMLLVLSFFWSRKLHKMNRRLKFLHNEVVLAKEKAEQEARTDALTGLSNRLAFFEKGEQVCREIKRLEKPVALLMLDIDDFKHINDSYGHDQGDRVIVRLAEIINSTKRDIDIGVRFGGEEFVVVVPFTDEQGAVLLAERIRKKVEESVIEYSENKIRFTVSIGVFSTYPTDFDLSRGLKNADDAMYRAKVLGKNRVCVFETKQVNPQT